MKNLTTHEKTKYFKRDINNLQFRFERILKNLDTDILNKDITLLSFEETVLKTDITYIKDFIQSYK